MPYLATVEMRSEKGPVRPKNEDCMGLLQAHDARQGIDALYVVADGLGGHERGDVASATAVEMLLKAFRAGETDETPLSPDCLESSLIEALRHISQVLYAFGLTGEVMHRDPNRAGMATTVTAALVAGETLCLGHVGDSRAYLLRRGRLDQLTEDHTLVAEQARRGSLQPWEAGQLGGNVLTQVVGLEFPINPYTRSLSLEDGDRLLLCTDGLHGFLDDQTIAAIIQRDGGRGAVDSIINQAIAAGSDDNITALLVSFAAWKGPPEG